MPQGASVSPSAAAPWNSRDAMATPPTAQGDQSLFDSAQPFRGVVVCCTSIPPELRSDIAAKTTELGGQHKYDLTPDCTHLIVGDYNTAKYRHVAKERPDVRVMAAGWVEAVRDLWVEDVEIDFLALETAWQLRTFETSGGEPTPDGSEPQRGKLLCCLTGFEDPEERQHIIDTIEANGGLYTGDLSKRVSHLIAYKPEGRKYRAAQTWGIVTVSVEWVYDSVERGLILDEKLYDPVLPKLDRGLGAWNKQKPRFSSLGKRLRESNAAVQDEGRRKLRKTASMKLNSQRDNLWGDILGKPQASGPVPAATTQDRPATPAALPPAQTTHPAQSAEAKSLDTQGSKLSSLGAPDDGAVFASCCFYVHGFSAQKTEILVNTIASLGGLICHSIEEVVSTSGAQLAHRFLIVPQTSAPEAHPRLPSNVHTITEFYIERCLHKKYFFDPSQHVIGRPFPRFPIPGFEDLTLCTAGFTGVDLNQVDKSIRQLGAKYEERFTANTSLLVCPSLSVVRKQKLELAVLWEVPVVSADWLWECISTGSRASITPFLFPQLKQNMVGPKVLTQAETRGQGRDNPKRGQDKRSMRDDVDQDLLAKPTAKPKQRSGLDGTAFATAREDSQEPTLRRKEPPATEHNSNATSATHFETAPTHAFPTGDASISFGNKLLASGVPLSEASFNSLNKTPATPRKAASQSSRKPFSRITSEVADSEATDGDVGLLDDLAAMHNEANAEKASESKLEEQSRNAEAEAAAAERIAISTKLVTSLLDSTTAKLSTTTTATAAVPAPAAAAAHSVPAPDGARGETPEELGSLSRPVRRKRNILGRAISNVSAASSTSNGGDSSASGAAAIISTTAATSKADAAGGAAVPASTQFKYEDPDAKRYKEQLLCKMMGKPEGESDSGTSRTQEKLTLAEMGGYDLAQQARYDTMAGAQRRSRRR